MAWALAMVLAAGARSFASEPVIDKTVDEAFARLGKEAKAAYEACPFSVFSKDYFARLTRDPEAKADENEVEISSEWRLVIPARPSQITRTMKGYFEDFLARCMQVKLAAGREETPTSPVTAGQARVIVWRETGGGVPDVAESFTIEVTREQVVVSGHDARGLRDGIVRLVDMMGLSQGPILRTGKQVCKPRLPVRLGAVPWLGSVRELIFLGYNAMCVNGGSLYGLSTSDAIAELKERRNPQALAGVTEQIAEAGRNGVKTYLWVDTRQKFAKDHPIFKAHPEIRGTLTWKADGDYVLCTEHPLVKQYLAESVEGLFRSMPQLDGLMIIVGGEGFYHCYMRSFGAPKGKSACPRCNKLGAEQTVANLCNMLAEAARKANPNAEVIAWPYSAEYVWSADRDQVGLIKLLKPGTGLLTEVEKDEFIDKPGFKKHLWDYSIDLIGPGERAKRQIAACQAAGVPIHIKSEPEWTFEAPRLPFIPCLDRWLARADGMAGSGATGAWMMPIKPSYGSSVAEVFKFAWWEPVPPADQVLEQLAERIAGRQGGKHLRQAWKDVSDAIPFSPELPSYYTGPYYLGPGQPMCADPKAKLPEVFNGRYLFLGEMTDAEGLMRRPTYNTSPTGNVPVFAKMYRQMEDRLRQAVTEVEAAEPTVPDRLRLIFTEETLPIRWFYHTARTEANFYESCPLRDRLLALAGKPSRTADEQAEAGKLYARWRSVLADEEQNTEQAFADHAAGHAPGLLLRLRPFLLPRGGRTAGQAEHYQGRVGEFLPGVAGQCGIQMKSQ